MNHTEELISSPEIDLSNYDQEDIHLPGAIQPHGVLLLIDPDKFIILQVSNNTEAFWGIASSRILNQPLTVIFSSDQVDEIKLAISNSLELINPFKILIDHKTKLVFNAIIHKVDKYYVIELEPEIEPENISFVSFYNLVRASVYKVQSAGNFKELTEFIATEVRTITKFDRVMIYQFDPDNNGQVVAEDKREGLESFLGLHYPASDITASARNLYHDNWVRLIADVNYQPIDIIPKNNPITNEPLDLSNSVLRSVSGCHIQYLKNMGVSATLCISLIKNNRLWGLIACHHYSPKYVPYDVRKACEFLGQMMSIELAYKENLDDYNYYRQKIDVIKKNLIQSVEKEFIHGLIKDSNVVLTLVKSEGAVVRFGEALTLIGKTPAVEEIRLLLEWLEGNYHQEVFYTDCLSKFYGEAGRIKEQASGILAISISSSLDFYNIIWFRPEVIQTVNWAGNPDDSIQLDERGAISLSPRKSFELWKEVVVNKSLPWKNQEINAALELRDALMLAALESYKKQLNHSRELAQITLQSIGDAVITTDTDAIIESLNPAAEYMTGWSSVESKGLKITKVFNPIDSESLRPILNPVLKVIEEKCLVSQTSKTKLISKDGLQRMIDYSVALIRDNRGNFIGTVLVFRDVTKEESLFNQLSWHNRHDALTGLVNRREFENKVRQAIMVSKTKQQTHAVCYLDLDQFKIINDTCGHIAGDELLRQLGRMLQSKISYKNVLARLGGDEFGILLNQCGLDQAQEIAIELCHTIHQFRFYWEDKTFIMGVSIGLVEINQNTPDLSFVLSTADTACYIAKNQGRNRVHIYHVHDQELIRQRGQMHWALHIPQALEENRFCLFYQEIRSLQSTDDFKHGEILIRLRDKSGEFVSPGAFLPAAERYDLMGRIDRWVVKQVFAYLAEYNKETFHQELYSVNLSGASLNDPQFIEFIYEQFSVYRINPQTICFEITETMAINNLTQAVLFITSLKELGCYFSLDDFGSGMSSFAYLKNLPVDYVKIDGGFVREILDNPMAREIVESIHRIGRVMNVKTVAEFVENEVILDELRRIGVDYAQGYYIGRPLPFIMP